MPLHISISKKYSITATSLFCSLFFFCSTQLTYAQSDAFEDDRIDLWETERQTPSSNNELEDYYIPERDFPEPIEIIEYIDVEPPEIDEPIAEPELDEIAPENNIATFNSGSFYLSNMTYGIATGLLVGALIAATEQEDARTSLRLLGSGIVLGGLIGVGVAWLTIDQKKAAIGELSNYPRYQQSLFEVAHYYPQPRQPLGLSKEPKLPLAIELINYRF